ncbi:MAG: hypothetical protein RLZZ387_3545 [Chloroflexota bacterium]|jgi:non-specific protein-tyrosine kinase
MDLLRYILLLRRWIWLLLLAPILSGGATYFISREMSPVYQASTKLLIEQASTGSAATDYSAILSSERLARTYAQLLTTRPILSEVIGVLQLQTTPDVLAEQVTVTPLRDTQLIVVTVEDSDPARAALVANTLAEVFNTRNRLSQSERFVESKVSLEQELVKLQTDIDSTQLAINGLQGAASQAERSRLQDRLAQYRTSYATVLKSLEEVRLAEAQQTSGIRAAEEAVAPLLPVRPRIAVNTALAAVVGLLLAVGLALLVEYLNDRVTTSEEAAALLTTSALASVGNVEGKTPGEKLVSLHRPYDRASEAYQMLRVLLEIARFEQPLQTLLVTSSNPGEGKSMTAANLAVTMARAGKRVVLIDADLRRPTLHHYFNHHNARGLTTALIRDPSMGVEEHLQNTKLDNLVLLPSGPSPADPAALLSSSRMVALIDYFKQRADLVIFDSPPLLAVAETTVLAHNCDATVLVMRSGVTRSSALRRASELLDQSGCKLAGVVLNRAAKDQSGSGYSGYYYGKVQEQPKLLERLFGGRRRNKDEAHGAVESAGVLGTSSEYHNSTRSK